MDCDQIRELLEAYTLGALDAEEKTKVELHLAKCPDCRDLADDYAEVVSTLPQALAAASSLTPPPRLKTQLLETITTLKKDTQAVTNERRVEDETVNPFSDIPPAPLGGRVQKERPATRPSWLSWWWPRILPLGGVIILLIVFLIWNVRLTIILAQERALRAEFANLVDQQEIVLEVIDSPETTRRLMRAVTPTSSAPPYGKVFTRQGLPHVIVMAARLLQPPPGQAYHLWLTVEGQTRLAGILNVNEDGFGLLVFDEDQNDPTYEQAQLTLQPIGSTTPATPPIILWQAD
jgi:hypothetical protein